MVAQYKLHIKQVVDYPRCRIYREFIRNLMQDRNIRTSGDSGLFFYTVLCSYANFQISYRHIDGINYTVYPEEWICSIKELSQWFRVRTHQQAVSILAELQKRYMISYLMLNRGKVIKYKIRDFKKFNTVMDHNCPYQNETGFFFLSVSKVMELIGVGACSEMDIILDLWISAIYNDGQVWGSEIGPVVYLRNGSGNPVVTYDKLAVRWGISRSAVGRIIKKLEKRGYVKLYSFPGYSGSVIYLRSYLSTMFQLSDILIDKEEIFMELDIKLDLLECDKGDAGRSSRYKGVYLSSNFADIFNLHIEKILQRISGILSIQGVSCFGCSKSHHKLFSLKGVCGDIGSYDNETSKRKIEIIKTGLQIVCAEGRAAYIFEMSLVPYWDGREEEK